MSEIINYNCHEQCADICMEHFCGSLATHYWKILVGDYKFLIPMCEKHFWKVFNKSDGDNSK